MSSEVAGRRIVVYRCNIELIQYNTILMVKRQLNKLYTVDSMLNEVVYAQR